MMRIARYSIAMLGALALSPCLGSGKEAPPTLLTLTSSAPMPQTIRRSSNEQIAIDVPIIPKELATTRVPAQIGPSVIAYIQDLQWVESPDQLFHHLLKETMKRMTNHVVLDLNTLNIDPRLVLDGTLSQFGYDAQERAVIVRYDAQLYLPGDRSRQIETRRFETREPADGTAATVGPALNTAANRVATEVVTEVTTRWVRDQ